MERCPKGKTDSREQPSRTRVKPVADAAGFCHHWAPEPLHGIEKKAMMALSMQGGEKRMRTPTMEDYLETIFNLIKEKGYARVADIAERLDVHPSSVTKMVQRLDKDEYLVYEKYRGFMLTNKGKKLGKRLVDRHELLESFLQLLAVPEDVVNRDVEGMEHHVSPETLDALSDLLQFFAEEPSRLRAFHKLRALSAEAAQETADTAAHNPLESTNDVTTPQADTSDTIKTE